MKDYIKVIKSLSNNCRKTKDGKYEAYVSNKKYIYLGIYADEKEAKYKIINYRVNVFVKSVKEYNLNPDDCKMFEDTYLVFPTGEIFNYNGKKIEGGINRYGYRVGIINNKFYLFHRIVANAFLPKIEGKDFVNHKDGNKQNNNVNNLEWCTKSENTIHSYANYLQDNITNQYGNFSIISESDITYIKENFWRNKITKEILAKFFNVSIGKINYILQKHDTNDYFAKQVIHIWSLKANYEILGNEINKCSRSIRHIVNKIGKEYNYEIFKHISNELRECL